MMRQLFQFLVEHGMPGGSKLQGRKPAEDFLGLKALLQVMLQRVTGAGVGSWHKDGLALGQHVAVAEVNICTARAHSLAQIESVTR